MNTMKRFVLAGIFYLFVFPLLTRAQEDNISKSEWLWQMAEQEQKIAAFIAGQLKNEPEKERLRKEFLAADRHEEVLSEAVLAEVIENNIVGHYRDTYFKLHPQAVSIYNPGRVRLEATQAAKPTGAGSTNMLCNYGDFETATPSNLSMQGYNGYRSGYTGGVCNAVPQTNVTYAGVGFGNPDDFLVTNNVPDPYVSGLKQTNNGSKHAIRINAPTPCPARNEINMLQKSFYSPVSGKARINFSYALVAEHPPYDHLGVNTFFLARVLDNSGNELGTRICVPTKVPPFYNTWVKACGERGAYVAWKDWTCAYIDFDAEATKTYTIEFFVADCAGPAHFAYAYVDDICAEIDCCPNLPDPPSNLKCVPDNNSSILSWNPVPGALSYAVSLTTNDPACCRESNFGLAKLLTTTGTSVTVPNTFASCFSWRVRAIMSEDCSTEPSAPMCSCTPPPPGPVGLNCTPGTDASNLSWIPIPGAVSYKVSITTNDPACCPNYGFGLAKLITTTTPNVSVTRAFAACFSWRVRAVLADGTETAPSASLCSCTPPPPPPTGLGCTPGTDVSNLYWNPVPGAASYKISITTNDPACCPNSGFGLAKLMTSTSPNVTVPRNFAECFSWRVRAVMPDGTETSPSAPLCSCTPPPREGGGGTGRFMNDETSLSGKMAVSAVPNPASEYIQFTVSGRDKQKTSGRLSVSIYDINGKEVVRKEMNERDQLRLDIHAFANGVYTYEIRSSREPLFKDKVIVEK